MKNSWRFFWTITGLLVVYMLWQLLHTPISAFVLILGLFLLVITKNRQGKSRRILFFSGAILLILSFVNTSAFWFLLFFFVLFIGLKGVEVTGARPFDSKFMKKKNLIIVETKDPEQRINNKKKNQWFGDERIGTSVFEWDDLNLSIFAGDTIIDLGNTLLPKTDNIILIRKVYGNTRILIPSDIAIKVQHQTVYGKLRFENEELELKNEQVIRYSEDYDQNTRRIKIISTGILGDFEVIRI